jgi:hypothetical protein
VQVIAGGGGVGEVSVVLGGGLLGVTAFPWVAVEGAFEILFAHFFSHDSTHLFSHFFISLRLSLQ